MINLSVEVNSVQFVPFRHEEKEKFLALKKKKRKSTRAWKKWSCFCVYLHVAVLEQRSRPLAETVRQTDELSVRPDAAEAQLNYDEVWGGTKGWSLLEKDKVLYVLSASMVSKPILGKWPQLVCLLLCHYIYWWLWWDMSNSE